MPSHPDKRRIPVPREDWVTLVMQDGLNPYADLPEPEYTGTAVVADFPRRWKRIGTISKGADKFPVYQQVASEVVVAYDPIQGALLYVPAGPIDQLTDQRIHLSDLMRISIHDALRLDQADARNELASALERRPRMRSGVLYSTLRTKS